MLTMKIGGLFTRETCLIVTALWTDVLYWLLQRMFGGREKPHHGWLDRLAKGTKSFMLNSTIEDHSISETYLIADVFRSMV